MDWLFVALSAYLFLAIANLLDKFLVDKVLKNSKAYAFIACIMGLVVLVISPWFIEWPGLFWFIFNIVSGFVFAIALWTLYEALKRGEAAKTLVFIGGLTPVFTILLSIFLFNEVYTTNQWLGMFFLLLGVLIIILLPESKNFTSRLLYKFGLNNVHTRYALRIAAVSALFYALYFVASKYAYNNQPFVSAFLWNRLGAGLFVLLFLIRKGGGKHWLSTSFLLIMACYSSSSSYSCSYSAKRYSCSCSNPLITTMPQTALSVSNKHKT